LQYARQRTTLHYMSKTITIRLDDKLSEMLDHVSEGTGRSKSEIMRDSLRRQLDIAMPNDLVNDAYPRSSDDKFKVSEQKENPIRDKSFEFALKIVRLYQDLQGQREYVLSKQLLRSGTSIGANVEEATAAESRRDFLHKLGIASKEARETNYWLRLLSQSTLENGPDVEPLLEDSAELVRMLTAIVKTTSGNSPRR